MAQTIKYRKTLMGYILDKIFGVDKPKQTNPERPSIEELIILKELINKMQNDRT